MLGKYREKAQSESLQITTYYSMASLLYIIHTTKYDYITKPQAVIQNYLSKHFLELFLGFCKTNLVIYEPIITRMLAAY